MRMNIGRAVALALSFGVAGVGAAQTVTVDATESTPSPVSGYLKLGSDVAPDGTRLGVNNRYLTVDGHPWLPVMGEVHFVRLPRAEWDMELARIKASGVDIVATYLFWNYHEETQGVFDWAGDRDVRAFVQAAARHGLKVVVRLGPWAHGEVRYGGVPDWVVHSMPTRGSDPVYMHYVERYWSQIAKQLDGLLWKQGGPIIGVQLENEYNLSGAGRGRGHIADLKVLALKHGLDVPFYSVTGWDGAVYPRREVLPVFGGYPDEPWGLTTGKLPPKETYAFRFDSRVSGNLGAETRGEKGDADPDIPNTPFLGAEFGAGVPTMYRRRPVMTADDIAAMLPVELGSGVNLYGYYMYHGGRNLIGRTTLEENSAIGGYNDLPLIDYDFQAPFGEYGESGTLLEHLRPFHYFLQSYGERLAPMTVRRPDRVPGAIDDLATLRWSVRADGKGAFVFVNNHVRQYAMPPHPGVRFTVRLPGGAVTFPSRPVTVQRDGYFIWPVGLDLDGQRLDWASAQPVMRIADVGGPLHVFLATEGIAPEFAFPAGTRVTGRGIVLRTDARSVVVTGLEPGSDALLTVARPGAPPVRLLVLTAEQGRHLGRVRFAGVDRMVLSDAEPVEADGALSLVQVGRSDFALSVWPALPLTVKASLTLSPGRADGVFTRYTAHAVPHALVATLSPFRPAQAVPPVPIGGLAGRAVQPYQETFGRAGAWTIKLPSGVLDGLDDAYMRITWAGDIARLFAGETLLDDRFYDGRVWSVGLKRNAAALGKPLTLAVLPLRADAPIYLDEALKPKIPAGGQIAEVRRVDIVPQYRLTIRSASE